MNSTQKTLPRSFLVNFRQANSKILSQIKINVPTILQPKMDFKITKNPYISNCVMSGNNKKLTVSVEVLARDENLLLNKDAISWKSISGENLAEEILGHLDKQVINVSVGEKEKHIFARRKDSAGSTASAGFYVPGLKLYSNIQMDNVTRGSRSVNASNLHRVLHNEVIDNSLNNTFNYNATTDLVIKDTIILTAFPGYALFKENKIHGEESYILSNKINEFLYKRQGNGFQINREPFNINWNIKALNVNGNSIEIRRITGLPVNAATSLANQRKLTYKVNKNNFVGDQIILVFPKGIPISYEVKLTVTDLWGGKYVRIFKGFNYSIKNPLEYIKKIFGTNDNIVNSLEFLANSIKSNRSYSDPEDLINLVKSEYELLEKINIASPEMIIQIIKYTENLYKNLNIERRRMIFNR